MSEERAAVGRSVEQEVRIEASPERVWRALTEARELERWFPLEASVEPGEGGEIRLSWGLEYDGTSRILAWEPPWRLATGWGGWDDTASSQVTEYLVEAEGEGTRLRVVTSGFPDDEAWDDWVEGTRHGWRFELASLKHYLERHEGRDRDVLYLRRRVAMQRAEAWERLFAEPEVGRRPQGGEPFADDPPWQYAAIVDDPPSALLRLTVDPCMGEEDVRDVTVFLSAWGGHADRIAELGETWRERLERVFPEGETL